MFTGEADAVDTYSTGPPSAMEYAASSVMGLAFPTPFRSPYSIV